MQEYRVVVVDESKLTHIALNIVFAKSGRLRIIAAVPTVHEARSVILTHKPELVLCETDIGGESGLELCGWIRLASPSTLPVLLSSTNDDAVAVSAMTWGAAGYLLKISPPEDLIFYLYGVLAGQQIIDDRVTTRSWRSGEESSLARFGLSAREREVLDEVLLGYDNRSIALRLRISIDTVKSHVKAILRKTGARDRVHVVAMALGRGRADTLVPVGPRQTGGHVA
ncbi:DNA-binding response regulator [Acrocarpospora phusangensis]|uniref:DNA-binding response regulator n=1 Tax=Acrocarpospora phusangensis TaxID=1070424 RepID=A0A919Q6E4_9ACTN|nr:response regulator transcription factor [Acrocarpospora phusangensis]GIH23264.1 DNA-binding response regulator [Acrocarpospora phusangensis]